MVNKSEIQAYMFSYKNELSTVFGKDIRNG
jgi:hypothetical protein